MNKKMGSGFHPFHLKQFYMPMKTLRFDWLSLDKPRSLCLYVSWGHFATHALIKFVRRVRRHFHIFSALQRIFNWVIDTFLSYFFGEGWKCMTSLPPFLTLWILVVFAGSSDEYILMIKVRTKREKRPKTWSLRFDLLTIKMCIWDYKSSRLISRCSCLTSMNYEVACGDDREIFVSVIEGSLEFDLTLLQLWNKIA